MSSTARIQPAVRVTSGLGRSSEKAGNGLLAFCAPISARTCRCIAAAARRDSGGVLDGLGFGVGLTVSASCRLDNPDSVAVEAEAARGAVVPLDQSLQLIGVVDGALL